MTSSLPYKNKLTNTWLQGRIIVNTIEKGADLLKEVEDNNNRAAKGEEDYYLVNVEDAKKILDLTLKFTKDFEKEINKLNNIMGETVIGIQPNYIMRIILNAKGNFNTLYYPDEGQIRMERPYPAMSRTLTEEAGIRNYDIWTAMRNYVWGMGRYIAYYPLVNYVNYELPFKVPQNFSYQQHLINYMKNILNFGGKEGNVDRLIQMFKTFLVTNALSYNPGMVILNMFQRLMASIFVEPKVWWKMNAIINPLNGDIKERLKSKYPNMTALQKRLKSGSVSIYMEAIWKVMRYDPLKSEGKLMRFYEKQAKIAQKIMEYSPFMYGENANWGTTFLMGVAQAASNTETFRKIYKELIESGMKKNEAWFKALDESLKNPVVYRDALASAQIVNAATNVDPSPVFSPLIFGRNNALSPLFIFWRFTANMANIIIYYVFNNPSFKNPWSQVLVNLFLYGNDEVKQNANQLMVLEEIRKVFTPENLDKIFGEGGEPNLSGLKREDMEVMGKAIDGLINGYKQYFKHADENTKKLMGGRLIGQRLVAFFAVMMVQFLITYLSSLLRQSQRENIGQYLIKPENRKAFLGKVVPKREIRKAVLNSVNIAKMISPKSIGTGIFPEVNIYNTTEWRSIVRALLRWSTTVAIPPLSLVDINLRTATGAGLDEIIYYNLIYEKKRK